MRISVQTPPQGVSFTELRDFWQAADSLGFAAAYVDDHLVPLRPYEGPRWTGTGARLGRQLDGWTTVAGLAVQTERLKIGVLVSAVTLRPPAVLARMAMTLDHLSGGRAVLGLGAGWHAEEHALFGIAFPSVAQRIDRLGEAIQLARAHGPAIPIIVGGSGRRVLELACRRADELNSFGGPDDWAARNRGLDRLLAEAGRPARDLRRSAYVFADLGRDRTLSNEMMLELARRDASTPAEAAARTVIGEPERAIAVLRAFARAGVDEVVLGLRPPYSPVQLSDFAHDVMPNVPAEAAASRAGARLVRKLTS